MKYSYRIYVTLEQIAAVFETNEPLPHLSVGTRFVLETDDYHQKTGTCLEVLEVGLTITYLDGHFVRYDVHVMCREVDEPLRFSEAQ